MNILYYFDQKCLKDKESEIVERKEEIGGLKSAIENHLLTIKSLNDKIDEHAQRQMQMQFRIDRLTVRAFNLSFGERI